MNAQEYAKDPEKFKKLSYEDQLATIADIILYCAQLKTDALRAAGKSRVDSCIEAQEFYDLEKYWTNVNMNIKKLVDLEITQVRRGV